MVSYFLSRLAWTPRLVTNWFLLIEQIRTPESEGSVRTGWEPRGTLNRVTYVTKDLVEIVLLGSGVRARVDYIGKIQTQNQNRYQPQS